MAYATLNFEHPITGALKTAPVGFSWTTLLFGFIPALLRGHWVWAVFIAVLAFSTFWFSSFVFSFIYNKFYIKYLIGEGYKVTYSSQDPKFIASKLKLSLPMAQK